jgi:solute carrier family 25 2-oxodicarboxylate transporter 21
MYPLDVVKTVQQLKVGQGEGTFKILFDIFKREKFGIYRGIGAPLLMETPKRAIKFTANNTFKPLFANKDKKLSMAGAAAAGSCAGMTEAVVVVPFELVKIRMQDRQNAARYASSGDAVVKIFRQEGPMAFYKGFESTLWRNAVWNATYFGMIHAINTTSPAEGDWKSGKWLMLRNFMIGAFSGALATTFNTPFDVVKSRFQNSANAAPWTWPSVFEVLRNEGPKALWKGYTPKVLRLGPGGGILLVVHQTVANWLVSRRDSH